MLISTNPGQGKEEGGHQQLDERELVASQDHHRPFVQNRPKHPDVETRASYLLEAVCECCEWI